MSRIDHNHLDQTDLDQYLLGKLAAEKVAVLEEHLVDCSKCIHQLKTTSDFLQAFRVVDAEVPTKTADASQLRLWYFWRTPLRIAFTVLGCGLFATAIIIGILAISQIRRLRVDVNQAQSVSAEWKRRFEEEQQSASLSRKERDEMERELGQLKANSRNEPDGPAPLLRRGVNVPLFVLNPARRREQGSSQSVNEVTLPKSPIAFVLILALESDLKYEDYLLAVSDDHGRRIWSRRGFKPNRYSSISVAFNSSTFRRGDYLLTVSGVTDQGGTTSLGTYPFRVTKRS